MSAKKVTFASKRPSQSGPSASIDNWVTNRDADVPEAAPPQEPMKRLTIDVPLSLHTRIKTACARRGPHMADEIRDLLEKHFPESTGEGPAS